MQTTEKLTCNKKLEDLLKGFLREGVTVEVHTTKDSACSTPALSSVEFKDGKDFVILTQEGYSKLFALVKPTPKMVKKIRVSGELAGQAVSKVFPEFPTLPITLFETALMNVTKEEFEEAQDDE